MQRCTCAGMTLSPGFRWLACEAVPVLPIIIMMKPYWLVFFLGFGICAPGVQADATLVYALSDGTAGTVQKKISLTRFFARVDSSDRPDEYLLYQAGKFFPLYRVDTVKRSYRLLSSSVDPAGLGAKVEDSPVPAAGEGADERLMAQQQVRIEFVWFLIHRGFRAVDPAGTGSVPGISIARGL